MTALPLRDFSAAEQDKLADIEAAPAAEESLRERVAEAICGSEGDGVPWDEWPEHVHVVYRSYADAAIAVLRGPSSDAERAVERVAGHRRDGRPRLQVRPRRLLLRGRARRVRRAAPMRSLRAGPGGAPADTERGERVNDIRELLDRLEKARAAATPGVWKLWGMTVAADIDGTSNVDTATPVAQTFYRDEHGKPRTWDAALICDMQRNLPVLVAALRGVLDVTEFVEACAVGIAPTKAAAYLDIAARLRSAMRGEAGR